MTTDRMLDSRDVEIVADAPAEAHEAQGHAAEVHAAEVGPVEHLRARRTVARTGRRRYLPLLVPALAMSVLGFWRLNRADAMGNDEVATRWISGLNLHAMAHVLNRFDAVHGLYYLIIHGWSLLGDSPTAIRVPSVLSMIAAVVVVAAIGVRLTDSVLAGTMCGLVAALTPSIGFYAQTARSYALVYLAVALATNALIRALDAESSLLDRRTLARRWLAYCLLIVLAGYLNELSLLILAAHLVTVVLVRRGRRTLVHWVVSGAVAALAVLPLVSISKRESGVLDYLAKPDLDNLRMLFHTYFAASTIVGVVLAAVAVFGVFTPPTRSGPLAPSDDAGPMSISSVSIGTVAVPLTMVPAGILLAYSEWFRPLYADRYVLFGEIGVALLIGAGLQRLTAFIVRPSRPVTLRWMPALLACLCVFAFQLSSQHSLRQPMSRQFDFGGPADVVRSDARAGDGVLFFDSFYRRTRLGYPAAFRGVDDFAMAVSPARSATLRGTNKPFAAIGPLMLEHKRIWVIGKAPGDIQVATPSIREQVTLLRRSFDLESRHRFGRITVTLWRRA